jgi:hypothetical protein
VTQFTQEQRQALEQGKPVQAFLEERAVVFLRPDVYQRIRAILEVERAVIEAGHTRGPVTAPDQLEALPLSAEDQARVGDVAVLPGNRYEAIRELVTDDRERTAWADAVEEARSEMAND